MRRAAHCLVVLASLAGAAPASAIDECSKNHYILEEPCTPSDPASWRWTTVGAMSAPRTEHSATLLADGRVLVAGGFGDSGALKSAEIYDPATRSWSLAGELTTTRSAHAAVRLMNGTVLAMSEGSAELYDPESDLWRPTGAPIAYRIGHAMTLLPDGRVLAVGGSPDLMVDVDFALRSAEIYDPASGQWRPTSSMAVGRIDHPLVTLRDGNILVAGGSTRVEYHGYTSRAEVFLSKSETWVDAGELALSRSFFTGVTLSDGSVLASGGGSACEANFTFTRSYSFSCIYARTERFVAGKGWSVVGDMTRSRQSHSVTLLLQGKVLAAAGTSWIGGLQSSTELYDPASATWSIAANMASARERHTATLLEDGTVLVVGGVGARGVLRSAELFAP